MVSNKIYNILIKYYFQGYINKSTNYIIKIIEHICRPRNNNFNQKFNICWNQ